MRTTALAALILIMPSIASAAIAGSFDQCLEQFPENKPPVVEETRFQGSLRALCYDSFAILHSGTTKSPVYAIEKLNRARIIDADEKRGNRFFADARLPMADRAQLDDYKGSGYQKGHMAPAADMPTPAAMAQSFSLANMIPQNGSHNQGTWSKIEKATRDYAMRATGDVYVFTGPLYLKTDWQTSFEVGAGAVKIPSHVFKVVLDAQTKKSWVHVSENRSGVTQGPPMTYKEFVELSGLRLLD